MQNRKLAALLGILLLNACHYEHVRDGDTDIRYTLSFGETHAFQDPLLNGLIIKMDSITDTRCPSGTTCLNAGSTAARVGVNGIFSTIALGATLPIIQNGKPYKVAVLDITPYPTPTNERATKLVTFMVEEPD